MSGTSDIDGNDQFRSSFLPVEAAGPSIARPAANLIITKQSIRHGGCEMKPASVHIAVYPRCGCTCQELPAPSRVDNEALICADWGTREALTMLEIRKVRPILVVLIA